jgi:predicted RNA binding protein YcfA (HicA-like mRNA interferase family)
VLRDDILPRDVTVREVLTVSRKDGWYVVPHPRKPSPLVTVAGQPGVEIPPGTLKSIWRQAGLIRED